MSEGGFILLHDLDGEGALIPTDFLMAVRGEILRDLTEEEKKSKITPIGVNKEGKRKIRCTVVYLHDSFNFCVSETPEEIYELLSEISYEATYEAEETDDDDPDPEEAVQHVPPRARRLERGSVQTMAGPSTDRSMADGMSVLDGEES